MNSTCVICGEPCDKIPYGRLNLSFCRDGCGKHNSQTAKSKSVPAISYSIPIGNYFAMDEDGKWWQYRTKPRMLSETWVGDIIPLSRNKNTKSWEDWKDSLHVMTENGLEKV